MRKSEIEVENLKKQEIENNQKIQILNNKKEEILNSLPNAKNSLSKQICQQNEYLSFKFTPHNISEEYIIKTLQKDLIDYNFYIKNLIQKKRIIIEKLIKTITIILNEITNDYHIEIFGSYANGLSLPWSDLNLVLINNNPNTIDNTLLMKLYHLLSQKYSNWIVSIKPIDTLPIRLIRVITKDEYKGMQLDISIQDDNHSGLKCVELINSYLSEYVALEPILIALKTILKNSRLNSPSTGGLNSYSLILMIVSYIQSKIDSNNYQEEENIIGKTFYGFLGYYGLEFDFTKYVILTYPVKGNSGDVVDIDTQLDFGQEPNVLTIVDPLDKKNNVGKYSYQWMNLKMAFMIAFLVSKEDCECGCHFGRAEHQHSLSSTEHCILKRMFNSVKRLTDSNKNSFQG